MEQMPTFTPIIDTQTLLDLPPYSVWYAPPIVKDTALPNPENSSWYGIANLGRLLLRIADGSETLADIETGLHYIGNAQAVRQELEDCVWPVYDFNRQEEAMLNYLGIKKRAFPRMVYKLQFPAELHGHARLGHQRTKLKGVRHCFGDGRMPIIADMGLHSRLAVERLFGVELDKREPSKSNPIIKTGDFHRILPIEGWKIRQKRRLSLFFADETVKLLDTVYRPQQRP